MARRGGRRAGAAIEPYYRKGGVKVRGYARGRPTKLFVDRDFKTRAKFRNGQLAGRDFSQNRYDLTAPIRDSKGRIFGRSPKISRNAKQVKANPFGKSRMLKVKEVGK